MYDLRTSERAPLSEGSIRYLAAGFVLSNVLDGPLRYLLHLVGASSFLYLRDGAAFVVVVSGVASWFRGNRAAFPVVAAAALLLFHMCIGFVSLNSPFQSLFGFKVFLPFLMGIVTAPTLRRQSCTYFCAVVFGLSSVGVVANQFLEYPWVGMSYDTAFGETVGSRLWWQSGATRLPGFARASFCAAAYVMVSLVPLLMRGNAVMRGVLVGITAYVFVLTTTKGVWLGLAALVFCEVLFAFSGSMSSSLAVLVALSLGCVVLPLISLAADLPAGPVDGLAESLVERIRDMWPNALKMLEPQQWLWGRGLGGIGVPQTYGDHLTSNSADNLMIYLIVMFGLVGLAYAAWGVWSVVRAVNEAPYADFRVRCMFNWTVSCVAYGYMTNAFEDPLLSLTFGAIVGISSSQSALSTEPRAAHVALSAVPAPHSSFAPK
jgi:hypothetical protein